jgi:hypothetical protein
VIGAASGMYIYGKGMKDQQNLKIPPHTKNALLKKIAQIFLLPRHFLRQ